MINFFTTYETHIALTFFVSLISFVVITSDGSYNFFEFMRGVFFVAMFAILFVSTIINILVKGF